MFLKSIVSVVLLSGALYSQSPLAAPAGLQVTAATKNAVTLQWNAVPGATGYQLERRAEPGAYAPVGTLVKETSASDSKIDLYTTYTYHVKAIVQKTGARPVASPASSEVRVGPPPAGFNEASATPKGAESDYGYGLSMALDANDDPVFAFVFRDPNRRSKPEENTLLVAGWDRAHYQWRQPVQVDVIGRFPDRYIPVSLARDASTGQLALAWVRDGDIRSVSFSDDNGITWKKRQTVAPAKGEREALSVTVALAGGKIHLAFFTAIGALYVTGDTSDEASKWTRMSDPRQPGMQYRSIGHMAVDASGKPAIAEVVNLNSGGVAVLYWRPGSNPIQALDSNKSQNDGPDVRVAFLGNKPRLLFLGMRDKVTSHNLWFGTSDDGASWTDPVLIPNDGNRGMNGPMTLAINSRDAYAVVASDNGGNWEGVKCGWPKLSLSSDGRQWSTCSPNASLHSDKAYSPSAAYAGNQLYLAYRSVGKTMAIMVWHGGAPLAAKVAVHK